MKSGAPERCVSAVVLGASVALAGCAAAGSPGMGHDESLLGYALTFLMVAAIGLAAALVVLACFVTLLAASTSVIAWNLVRPHPVGRALGVGVAVLDTLAGSVLLAGLLWLSVDTSEGALRVDLDGGGLLALFALALLVIAPATFLSAIAPRRPPSIPIPPAITPSR